MALLYPWATKEYCLWKMSLGQLILYHNLGIEMKYGGANGDGKKTYKDLSPRELRKAREEAREQLRIIDEAKSKEQYRAKYGAI